MIILCGVLFNILVFVYVYRCNFSTVVFIWSDCHSVSQLIPPNFVFVAFLLHFDGIFSCLLSVVLWSSFLLIKVLFYMKECRRRVVLSFLLLLLSLYHGNEVGSFICTNVIVLITCTCSGYLICSQHKSTGTF